LTILLGVTKTFDQIYVFLNTTKCLIYIIILYDGGHKSMDFLSSREF